MKRYSLKLIIRSNIINLETSLFENEKKTLMNFFSKEKVL